MISYTHFLCPFICDGHLGSYHVLAIVNRATVNIGVHVSFQIMSFFIKCLGVGLLGYMLALYLVF